MKFYQQLERLVFSTYVEVILSTVLILEKWDCFLHVCGGDPSKNATYNVIFGFSPRMWR